MPAYGFDGTITENVEANRVLRSSELAYRHGVWSGGGVSVGAGTRGVSVAPVDGIIAGVWFTTTTATVVNLAANAGSNKRIDYIVAEANWSTNDVTIKAVQGVAAATPTAPSLTQNAGGIWQMPLARVTVAGNATVIAAADIEPAAVRRWQSDIYRGTIAIDTIRGNATNWNNLGTVTITDPGRPYRVQVSALVRFDRTSSGGFMRLRATDPDTGDVFGEAVTSSLGSGKAAAVLGAVISPQLVGSHRVRLEMFPNEMGDAEVAQVLDYTGNHFTVLPLPA